MDFDRIIAKISRPFLHPLDWLKDNFHDRLCLWFIIAMTGWQFGILMLLWGFPVIANSMMILFVIGLVLFLLTLIYFCFVEAQKKIEQEEKRRRNSNN